MQSELEQMGFTARHAKALASAIDRAGCDTLNGLRFEVSGQLTSVFYEGRSGRRIVCQVEAVPAAALFIADTSFGGP